METGVKVGRTTGVALLGGWLLPLLPLSPDGVGKAGGGLLAVFGEVVALVVLVGVVLAACANILTRNTAKMIPAMSTVPAATISTL